MLTLITEVHRGAGWDRVEKAEPRGSRQQSRRGGWREFGVYKVQLINVVNENETKWTHFRLIIHPAQVKRSGVREGMCTSSEPVGLPLLINTSEDGRRSRSKRTGRRRRHSEGKGDMGWRGGVERGVTRNVR